MTTMAEKKQMDDQNMALALEYFKGKCAEATVRVMDELKLKDPDHIPSAVRRALHLLDRTLAHLPEGIRSDGKSTEEECQGADLRQEIEKFLAKR